MGGFLILPAVRFNFRCDCDLVVSLEPTAKFPAVRFNFRCDCDLFGDADFDQDTTRSEVQF